MAKTIEPETPVLLEGVLKNHANAFGLGVVMDGIFCQDDGSARQATINGWIFTYEGKRLVFRGTAAKPHTFQNVKKVHVIKDRGEVADTTATLEKGFDSKNAIGSDALLARVRDIIKSRREAKGMQHAQLAVATAGN